MKSIHSSLLALLVVALATVTGCASTDSAMTADKAASHADKATPEMAHLGWSAVEQAVAAGAILVDARGADAFAAGHIAGAINIPYKSTDAATWAKLPADKSTKVITYCGGPACSASLKAAVKCQEMGYTDVAEYKGGFPEWKKLTSK